MADTEEDAGEPIREEDLTHEQKLEFALAVLALLKEHAEELKAKGLPVDKMIRDLEAQLVEVRAAEAKMKEAQAADAHLTQKREASRREFDEAVAALRLPPDLTDGMATIEYMAGIAGSEVRRPRRDRSRQPGN